jgi:hypothetical protein
MPSAARKKSYESSSVPDLFRMHLRAGVRIFFGRSVDGAVWMGGGGHVFRVIWFLGAFQRLLPDSPRVLEGHPHAGKHTGRPFPQVGKPLNPKT